MADEPSASSPRRLRPRKKPAEIGIDLTESPPPVILSTTSGIRALPVRPTQAITRLPRESHRLLLRKHDWLKTYDIDIPRDIDKSSLAKSIQPTLVFGQEEAGTAVCVSPSGLLLTCAHCVAETTDDAESSGTRWLVFASGRIVEAQTIAWDPVRDLALLKVVAAQADPTRSVSFPYIRPAATTPPLRSKLVCVGHPGSEDLEVGRPGVKTGYDILCVSTGVFRGHAAGQNLQDNSEIGALMHDCWTYWGHSGAPLVDRRTGELVGLHSSWDDVTAMRRGIALEAIQEFLEANKEHWSRDSV